MPAGPATNAGRSEPDHATREYRRTQCARVLEQRHLTPPCPGLVEAFCIGSCQDLFRGEDWRLGLFVPLKTGVAGPECSKQGETRLAGFPTILRTGRLPRIIPRGPAGTRECRRTASWGYAGNEIALNWSTRRIGGAVGAYALARSAGPRQPASALAHRIVGAPPNRRHRARQQTRRDGLDHDGQDRTLEGTCRSRGVNEITPDSRRDLTPTRHAARPPCYRWLWPN